MNKIFKYILLAVVSATLLISCEKYDTVKEVDTDFVRNYEAFWNMINDEYCFLGDAYNNDKNVDWKAVYEKWMPIVKNDIKSEYELFNIMAKSLDVLRDGHIWMYSDFKIYYNEEYKLKPDGETYYGSDYDKDIITDYYLNLSTGKDDYSGDKAFVTRNKIKFGIIERAGKKFAYMHYPSFTKAIADIDYIYLDPIVQKADGIIFDIRDNTGGVGEYGIELAGHFMKEKKLVAYSAHKNGSGYNDFSELYPMHCTPSDKYNWADKQTALLTNRDVYSTANLFTYIMKHAPNVVQVGQPSGGGGGLPMTHYLPNGWLLVFSSNILLDLDKNHIEPGIAPDIEAVIGDDPTKDGIIEAAIEELLKRV